MGPQNPFWQLQMLLSELWGSFTSWLHSVDPLIWAGLVLVILIVVMIVSLISYTRNHNDPNDYPPMW